MAITTFAGYKTARTNYYQSIPFRYASKTVVAGRPNSLWTNNTYGAGAAPGAARQCSSATTGALGLNYGGFRNATGFTQRIAAISVYSAVSLKLDIYDRLADVSGLNANNPGVPDLFSLTLPARITDNGVGLHAYAEIYTQIGVTAAGMSISYTNVAGTSGRDTTVGPCINIMGATGAREVNYWNPVPWAVDSDNGVRSVQAAAFATTATGTAGNYGITLAKRLVGIDIEGSTQVQEIDLLLENNGYLPEVLDDACLFMVVTSPIALTGEFGGHLHTILT